MAPMRGKHWTTTELAEQWGLTLPGVHKALRSSGQYGNCTRASDRLLLVPDKVKRAVEAWREKHGRRKQT